LKKKVAKYLGDLKINYVTIRQFICKKEDTKEIFMAMTTMHKDLASMMPTSIFIPGSGQLYMAIGGNLVERWYLDLYTEENFALTFNTLFYIKYICQKKLLDCMKLIESIERDMMDMKKRPTNKVNLFAVNTGWLILDTKRKEMHEMMLLCRNIQVSLDMSGLAGMLENFSTLQAWQNYCTNVMFQVNPTESDTTKKDMKVRSLGNWWF